MRGSVVAGSLLALTSLACGSSMAADQGEDELGADTDAECLWPLGAAPEGGVEHQVRVVNDTDEVRFLITRSCELGLLRFSNPVNGQPMWDESATTCSELMNAPQHPSCDDPCPDEVSTDAIRVEPGASHSLTWDGHAWKIVRPEDECLEALGACFRVCQGGVRPELGVALNLHLRSARCSPEFAELCACDPVDGVCVVEAPFDLEALFGLDVVDHELAFVVGQDELVVELSP